jgi:hypothetical protein
MPPKRGKPLHPRGPVHETPEMIKAKIWTWHTDLHMPVVMIAKALDMKHQTVSVIINTIRLRGTLHPKRGRPRKIYNAQPIVDGVLADPTLTIRRQSKELHDPASAIYLARITNGLHFYKTVPIPGLLPRHLLPRKIFCDAQTRNPSSLPIIFTDESTVQMNLKKGSGIWRHRGAHPVEGFFVSNAHPLSVMVWGAIGPGGWRSELILCPASVNTQSYYQFLTAPGGPIEQMNQAFGPRQFIFQQDNATPHKANEQRLLTLMNVLKWPAKSPDLSPIEQIWALIKRKLRGRVFSSREELFAAISEEWNNIPNDVIENYWSSFRARCVVCARLNGACLNTHWGEVHREHHPPQPMPNLWPKS